MIKSFTITNHLGDSIKLELARPDKSGFVIKSVDGLGPTKATINMSNMAMHDGASYNSARLERRDIIMNLEFFQDSKESIEDIRLKSYKYFPIKKKIQIVIETDNRLVETSGYVEANEPSIFSDREGCVITITCPDPYLYSVSSQETVFSGVAPRFEFPFINESLDEDLLEFGEIETRKEQTVLYKGDIDTGVTISIYATENTSDIIMHNLTSNESMTINSHKIGLMMGHYEEYTSYVRYPCGSVVLHDNRIWLSIKNGGTSSAPQEETQGYDWFDITNIKKEEISEWSSNVEYSGGSNYVTDIYKHIVTHVGKIWYYTHTTVGGVSTTHEPGVSDRWVDITDMVPPCLGLKAGDAITINTQKGYKSVYLLRDSVKTNLINTLDKNTNWFTIEKGDNVFMYKADTGGSGLQFCITNKIVYEGV